MPIRTRTDKYRRSVIPAAVNAWNSLDKYTRTATCTSLWTFKNKLQDSLLCKKIRYLGQHKGKDAISHTRIRPQLGPLKAHLHNRYIHIVMSAV